MTWSPGFSDGDAGADLAHNPRAFMAEDGREEALAVEAVERVGVRVTDAGGLDLHKDFSGLRPLKIKLDNLERLLGFERDGGAGFHR